MSTVVTGSKKTKTEKFPWNEKMEEFFVTLAKIYSWDDVEKQKQKQKMVDLGISEKQENRKKKQSS